MYQTWPRRKLMYGPCSSLVYFGKNRFNMCKLWCLKQTTSKCLWFPRPSEIKTVPGLFWGYSYRRWVTYWIPRRSFWSWGTWSTHWHVSIEWTDGRTSPFHWVGKHGHLLQHHLLADLNNMLSRKSGALKKEIITTETWSSDHSTSRPW